MHKAGTLTALITVQVLFGAWPVAGKVAFAYMDPLALAAARTVGGAIVLWVLFRQRAMAFPIRERWRAVTLYAALAVIANQVLFILGLARTTAVNATLIVATIPVITYAIAVATRREDLGPRRAVGLAMAFSGIALLLGVSGLAAPERALGDALVLANSIAFSWFLVLAGQDSRRGSLGLTVWMFVFASVVAVPLGLVVGAPTQLAAMDATGWWVLAFIVAGPTVATYSLNNTALARVPASTVAAFIYLQPLVAGVMAWFILNERPDWRIIPAAALVLGGLGLVARFRRPKTPAVPAD